MDKLTLENITKSFPPVKALSDVTMSVRRGEIHSICGENGAGKSTLMNILTGNLQPDSGSIVIEGVRKIIPSPQHAFDFGIAIVHQHLSLIESLNIAENIFANQQPVNKFGFIQRRELYVKTNEVLRRVGMNMSADTFVSSLSQADKQMIEIAKALSKNPSVLILDEPTASLSEKETNILFDILRTLRAEGISILYISHRLQEIFKIADRVTILKDGHSQGTFDIKALTRELLISKMVGRDLIDQDRKTSIADKIVLEVKNISGRRFQNISFKVHAGEIVGFAGLVGAGRTEIARAIFGIDEITDGEIVINGSAVSFDHPCEAIEKHLAYVPEDRKRLGLFSEMSICENIVSANLRSAFDKKKSYSKQIAREIATHSKQALRISASNVDQPVSSLSGGNQQKVLLAKWLNTKPNILIVDEPTHGIDVGSKHEIYQIIAQLASEGKGIVVISSDLPELLGVCDRIITFKEGMLTGVMDRKDATEEKIMRLSAN